MNEEIRNFIYVEQANKRSSRYGYFERILDTWYGKMEDYKLHVIATEFQTPVFKPYQQRDGSLEETAIPMYNGEMSNPEHNMTQTS